MEHHSFQANLSAHPPALSTFILFCASRDGGGQHTDKPTDVGAQTEKERATDNGVRKDPAREPVVDLVDTQNHTETHTLRHKQRHTQTLTRIHTYTRTYLPPPPARPSPPPPHHQLHQASTSPSPALYLAILVPQFRTEFHCRRAPAKPRPEKTWALQKNAKINM